MRIRRQSISSSMVHPRAGPWVQTRMASATGLMWSCTTYEAHLEAAPLRGDDKAASSEERAQSERTRSSETYLLDCNSFSFFWIATLFQP